MTEPAQSQSLPPETSSSSLNSNSSSSPKEIQVGQNRIYLDENNLVHFINVGEIDEEIALKSREAMRRLMNLGEGAVSFLIDLNKGGKTTPAARKILREFTENEVQGRLAFWGLNPVARILASFFMNVTKKEQMRFFKTRKKALDWLGED